MTTLVDVTAVEKELAAELVKEAVEDAKVRLKAKQRSINQAQKVLVNLRREYEELKLDIAEGS